MKKLFLLISLILYSNAIAGVPYTFSPGTTIYSSQVNQNFNDLDERISAIEDGTQSSGANNCGSYSYVDEVTYEYKPANVGDELIFSGDSYQMVLIPFREFGTGDLYYIKLPVKDNSGQCVSILQTFHIDSGWNCNKLTISGFPSSNNTVFEQRMISSYVGASIESKSTVTLSFSTSIKINETLLNISLSINKTEDGTVVSAEDYDLTDNFNTNNMVDDPSLVQELDNMIDYIQITKIE